MPKLLIFSSAGKIQLSLANGILQMFSTVNNVGRVDPTSAGHPGPGSNSSLLTLAGPSWPYEM